MHGEPADRDQNSPPRPTSAGTSLLSPRQRRWAWTGFLGTAAYAPFAAHAAPDASWLFSLVISGMIAVVLVADDAYRRPATQRSRGR